MKTQIKYTKFWKITKKLKCFWLALALAAVPMLAVGITVGHALGTVWEGLFTALFCLHFAAFAVAITDTAGPMAAAFAKPLKYIKQGKAVGIFVLLFFWQYYILIEMVMVFVCLIIAPIYLIVVGVKS